MKKYKIKFYLSTMERTSEVNTSQLNKILKCINSRGNFIFYQTGLWLNTTNGNGQDWIPLDKIIMFTYESIIHENQ